MSYSTNVTVWCDAEGCLDHIVTSAGETAGVRSEAKSNGWFYRKIKGASTLEKRGGRIRSEIHSRIYTRQETNRERHEHHMVAAH